VEGNGKATLADLRRAVPLTQRELAAAADVSESTIRKLETGRALRPRPRTMRSIAAALRVPVTEIAAFQASLRPRLGQAQAAQGGQAADWELAPNATEQGT
jgi:transcriptional regulator with XRE-family HTH domain